MNLPVATTNNKQMLSSYVHDVYELEEKIYATEKLVADLENKRADFIDKQKSMIPTRPICQRKVPTKPYKEKRDIKKYISESQRIKKIENEYSNKLKKECKFRPVRFFVVYGVFLQVFLVAYIPLWFYFSNMLNLGTKLSSIIGVIIYPPLVLLIRGSIYFFKVRKRRKNIMHAKDLEIGRAIIKTKTENDEIKKANDEIEKWNEYVDKSNAQIQKENIKINEKNEAIEEENNKAREAFPVEKAKAEKECGLTCEAYDMNIAEVRKYLASLKELRRKTHSLGILPPDYRELPQLYMFDHYFRNGLAENMKEAVLLYKEDKHREIMESGIEAIFNMLNSLSEEMRNFGRSLERIHREVASISQETFQMRFLQEDSMRAAESFSQCMLKETRAQRYAAEALKEKTERLVWYEDQRRLGKL